MAAPAEQKASSRPTPSLMLAVVIIFAGLIAVATVLSIPLPAPLYEITWAPAIYLALGALADPLTAFTATGLGSFIGEAYNISFKGGGSPIYPFGMVWARAPEVLIVAWAKQKGEKTLALAMVSATIFETLAFFFPDWAFYVYGVFGYGSPTNVSTGFYAASTDFFTLVDLAYVPVALALIREARPAFRRLGFE